MIPNVSEMVVGQVSMVHDDTNMKRRSEKKSAFILHILLFEFLHQIKFKELVKI